MNFKNFFKNFFPKTKEQKHLDWLNEEVEKGHYLHIDDGVKNNRK